MEKRKQLDEVLAWVDGILKQNLVPTFNEIYDYAYRELGFKNLKPFEISKAVRLLPAFQMNSQQKRKRLRGNRHRPMIVNNVGHLHGDIGFYSVVRDYETPISYRSGFLVCKDTLSRMTYVAILHKQRTAEQVEKAFTQIFEQFKKHNNGAHVISVAFDMERSVMGKKIKDFFERKKIKFHAFQNTSSKSKMAENSIRLIRHTVSVMRANPYFKEQRWWNLIKPAVDILNRRPLRIDGKYLKYPDKTIATHYSPENINQFNLKDFISKLHKAVPAYYFSQYDVSPQDVKFKFNVGDYVRVKLIISSSEVIGIKRSEVTLNAEIFIVKKQLPYISKALTIEKAYVCESLKTQDKDVFDEDDIVLAPRQNGVDS